MEKASIQPKMKMFAIEVRERSSGMAGDLIGDMSYDKTLRDFGSLAEFRSYLRFHNACDEAVKAAPAVWRRFERWRQKQA
jgi:hypothetical protein